MDGVGVVSALPAAGRPPCAAEHVAGGVDGAAHVPHAEDDPDDPGPSISNPDDSRGRCSSLATYCGSKAFFDLQVLLTNTMRTLILSGLLLLLSLTTTTVLLWLRRTMIMTIVWPCKTLKQVC